MAQDTAAMSTSIKLLTDLLFPSLPSDAREPLSPSLRTELSTAALEWMATRSPGQPKIRIRTVTDGGAAFAILEVLNDDMPFLVDSVIGEGRREVWQFGLYYIRSRRCSGGRMVFSMPSLGPVTATGVTATRKA